MRYSGLVNAKALFLTSSRISRAGEFNFLHVTMRYNAIPLASLGKNALTHYWPVPAHVSRNVQRCENFIARGIVPQPSIPRRWAVHYDGTASITIIGQLIAQCQ